MGYYLKHVMTGYRVYLNTGIHLLGKSGACNVVLTYDNMSDIHAVVVVRNGRIFIKDLVSCGLRCGNRSLYSHPPLSRNPSMAYILTSRNIALALSFMKFSWATMWPLGLQHSDRNWALRLRTDALPLGRRIQILI